MKQVFARTTTPGPPGAPDLGRCIAEHARDEVPTQNLGDQLLVRTCIVPASKNVNQVRQARQTQRREQRRSACTERGVVRRNKIMLIIHWSSSTWNRRLAKVMRRHKVGDSVGRLLRCCLKCAVPQIDLLAFRPPLIPPPNPPRQANRPIYHARLLLAAQTNVPRYHFPVQSLILESFIAPFCFCRFTSF